MNVPSGCLSIRYCANGLSIRLVFLSLRKQQASEGRNGLLRGKGMRKFSNFEAPLRVLLSLRVRPVSSRCAVCSGDSRMRGYLMSLINLARSAIARRCSLGWLKSAVPQMTLSVVSSRFGNGIRNAPERKDRYPG